MVDPLRWVRLDHTTGKYVNREDITPEMSSHYAPFSMQTPRMHDVVLSKNLLQASESARVSAKHSQTSSWLS